MGIQLSSHDKHMILQVVEARKLGMGIHPLLYGYLSTAVEMFVSGVIDRKRLADYHALCELLEQLNKTRSARELSEIAYGTRELAGEDVHDGQ